MTDEEREYYIREINCMMGQLDKRDDTFIRQIKIMIKRYIEKSRQ